MDSLPGLIKLNSAAAHPRLPLDHAVPLFVPSVWVDSTSPWVNYVASDPRRSIATEKEHLQ
jgi:hypothetical protein